MGNLILRYGYCIALGLLLLWQTPVSAQEVPPDIFDSGGEDSPDAIGVIPGTNMLRDEFRARAMIQLKAVALNALAYRLANDDEYPQFFRQLQKSKAWNLDVINMFTGEPIKAIYFEPGEDDMTTRMVLDLPLDMNEDEHYLGMIDIEGGQNLDALGKAIQSTAPSTLPRIDPQKVKTFVGGDIIYYVSGDMLQLIMYAPDGTFIEHVDVKPNGHWRSQLNTAGSPFWPDSIGAAQVLFFAGMVPQHHNLVEFMGNRETLPAARLTEMTPSALLDMSRDLQVIILNPITRAPATSQPEYSLGDFVAALSPVHAVPLSIYMRDGKPWTLAELNASSEPEPGTEPSDQENGHKPPANHPPLGGRA